MWCMYQWPVVTSYQPFVSHPVGRVFVVSASAVDVGPAAVVVGSAVVPKLVDLRTSGTPIMATWTIEVCPFPQHAGGPLPLCIGYPVTDIANMAKVKKCEIRHLKINKGFYSSIGKTTVEST